MPSEVTIQSAQLKIGMEIHVELSTRSKMFSRSKNVAHRENYDSEPNTLLDQVVLGLPGALPVMNRAAVERSMMVGLALDCSIAEFSRWDRKNYFYPDLPKGYQISQYDLPLCFDGRLSFTGADGEEKTVGIIRAHLEEDTGKLGHELPGGFRYDGSLVDLNRAGTPLLEIVTHPDLTSADDAVEFAKELRNICRFLGVSECIMQRGHIRFEPNVNVIIRTDDGREFATPIVEVKNLNSFKAVKNAIEYEYKRQIAQWKNDRVDMGPGMKTTRGWDDAHGETVLQREKEDAHDYRYFPDPDLPPVVVSDEWRASVAAQIPELPRQRRERYIKNFNLTQTEAYSLTEDFELSQFFEEAVSTLHERLGSAAPVMHAGRSVGKLLLNAGAKRANERDLAIQHLGIVPEQVAQIVELRDAEKINSSAADELFGLLCDSADDAETIAQQNGLLQVRDDSQLEQWVNEAIEQQKEAAADFAAGKDAALGRLTGAIMKISAGQADPKAVQQKLREKLRP